jgi:hypothetical protein
MVQALVLEVAKNRPKLEKTEAGEASTNSSRGRIDARKHTMDCFAEVLSREMDLPEINQTGLDRQSGRLRASNPLRLRDHDYFRRRGETSGTMPAERISPRPGAAEVRS